MPARLISAELLEGKLKELSYEGGARFTLTPHLVYSSDRPLGRAGQLLCDLIQQAFTTERPLALPPNALERWLKG